MWAEGGAAVVTVTAFSVISHESGPAELRCDYFCTMKSTKTI